MAALAPAAARAAGLGEVRTVSVGAAELARRIEQHFPVDARVLDLADARATRPRLRLLPEANRIAIDVDLQLTERVLGAGARGRMAFDAGLRFDAAEAAIRLTQARVRSFQFDGLPPDIAGSVTQIGRQLAEQFLDELVVYRPPPQDLRSVDLLGYRPGAITVLGDAVRLTLEPL